MDRLPFRDEGRLQANVWSMRERLSVLGVAFRPHLKTTKSIEVAPIAMTLPSGPVMVSTLREAEFFANSGILDIVYGVGIAPDKLPRVAELRRRGVDVAVVLDSVEHAESVAGYAAESGDPLPAFIDVDVDRRRSGVQTEPPFRTLSALNDYET